MLSVVSLRCQMKLAFVLEIYIANLSLYYLNSLTSKFRFTAVEENMQALNKKSASLPLSPSPAFLLGQWELCGLS